jgi:hypothetical protein
MAQPDFKIRKPYWDFSSNRVEVSFETLPEATQGWFVLQKSSDSLRWVTLSRIQAKQIAWAPYAFRSEVISGGVYFRVVWFSGATDSTVMMVQNHPEPPAQVALKARVDIKEKRIELDYKLEYPQPVLLRVYDHVGRQVHTESLASAQPGLWKHELRPSNWGSGKYLFVITQIANDQKVAEMMLELPTF